MSTAALAVLVGFMVAFGGVRAGHAVPHAPTITSITPGDRSLTVVWAAPTDTGNSAITAYDVRSIETSATDKADGNWTVADSAWTSGSLTYAIAGLAANVEYDVQVRAVNADGDGDWSTTEIAAPLVAAPSIGPVTTGDQSLTVSWAPPTGVDHADISAYDVRYIESVADKADVNWTVISQAWTSGALRYVVTGLTNGRSYDVQVRAVAGRPGVWSAAATGTPAEHGGSTATATALTLDARIGGAIDRATDVDYFSFDLPDVAEVLVFTSGELDTKGELQNSVGETINENDKGEIANSPGNFLIWDTLDAGRYYVRVASSKGETGFYTLHARSFVDSTGLSDARTIEVGSFENGIIDPGLDRDYFKIELDQTADLTIRSTGLVYDTVGALIDSEGSIVAVNDDGYLFPNIRQFLIRERLSAGVYYIRINGWLSLDVGPYTLYVDVVAEPGNAIANASPISIGDVAGGRIDSSSDVDYFRLDLAEATYVYIQAVSATVDIDGALLDAAGNQAPATIFDHAFDFSGAMMFAIRDRLEAGTYFIEVTRSAGAESGPYTIGARAESEYGKLLSDCSAIATRYSDPYYGCQWHLSNSGQLGGSPGEDIKAEAAWTTNQGSGVSVAVVDDGMDFAHEDLRDNVDTSRNHDYTGGNDIALPLDDHGTRVAGLVAARDNSLGMRGVAPRATIFGFNFLQDSTDANSYHAMTNSMATTAVSNNSWGPRDGPGVNAASLLWELGVDLGVQDGYGGKGVFYVFAAGNGGDDGDNANLDGYGNYYGVTAVCAVNDLGQRANYSEPGANLWVCSPSGDRERDRVGIATTTNHDRYTGNFSGTSASAPIVSGVAALLRGANTSLTWRDVKLILAASARRNDPTNPGWETGALEYGSTTERYHFNHEYGFGVVDARAALDLAQDWTNVPDLIAATVDADGPEVTIPDSGTPVESTITMGSDVAFTEFVAINVEFDAPVFRNLRVELVSPSGTTSVLSTELEDGDIYCFFLFQLVFGPCGLDESFRFGSARHLGENPEGGWTLRVSDRVSGNPVATLRSWSLTIYGQMADVPGSVTLSGRQPQVDTQLTAALTDPDGSISGLSWTWERSPNQSSWTTISGATSAAYTPVSADVGSYVRATASYTDGHRAGKVTHGVSEYPARAVPPSNAAPEFPATETGARSVSEDSAAGEHIGTPVIASDPDNDILTFALEDAEAAEFEIVAASGQLRTKAALDYETAPTRAVTVTATDPSGIAATIDVTITVTDADDAGTVSLSSTQPRVATALTAQLIEPDGSVTGLTWTWERSPDQSLWTVIEGGASATYTPVADDFDQFLRATAFYSDAFGSGKSAEGISDNAVVAQSAPSPPPSPSPPPPSPPASRPSGPPASPSPPAPPAPPAPAAPQGIIGGTPAATAVELPGNRLLIQRHDVPEASFELAIGSISADGRSVVLAGVIRDATLGQTYLVVRRQSDGRIVRRWVPPSSPFVYQIPWAIVNTQYTVPVGVIGAIPLDDQFPEPNLLVRRFDGGDDRIFGFDAALRQWRHVPDIATFQSLDFYWCNVTVADAAFFDRFSPGPPYPASDIPAKSDYPNCLTS